jgi:hypothetical protein
MNSDFELCLSSKEVVDNPKRQLVREELEYLVWWLSDEVLSSKKYYSQEYLDYLKEYKLNPLIDYDINAEPFWAKEPMSPIQLKLNSKRNNALILNQLGVNAFSYIVPNELDELESIGFPIFLKEEFSFSGSGLLILRERNDYLYWKERLRPYIKDYVAIRYLKPTSEFGVSYDQNNYNIHQNLIDEKGQFRGCMISDQIREQLTPSTFSKIELIINHYKSEIFDHLGIDFFLYNDAQVHFCEINHRKTMGHVAHKIKNKFFSDNKVMGLFMLPQRRCRYFESFSQLTELVNNQAIILSPLGNKFLIMAIAGDSIKSVESTWDKLKAKLTP